ncbi:MAG TPA: hypothetical protein VK826_15790 [Bacteroidia bacterium]|nr:hypothetical protein [Bacteroidia bacterium]
MIRSVVLLYLTDFLAAAAYYAFLMILGSHINALYDSPMLIGSVYQLLFTVAALSALIFGFFADLTRRSPLFAILGLAMSLLGFIILVFSPRELAKAGILLVFIGYSVFKTNLIAGLYAVTREKRAKFEGFYMILWLIISLGASVGPGIAWWLFGLSSGNSMVYTYASCAVVFGVATVLVFINYKSLKNSTLISFSETYQGSLTNIVEILIFFFVSFWIWIILPGIQELTGCVPRSEAMLYGLLGSIVFLAVAITISFATRISIFFKTIVGFVALVSLLELLPLLNCDYSIPILKSAAEIFIVPILAARILMSSPSQFTVTFAAIFGVISMFSAWTRNQFSELMQDEPTLFIHGFALGCLVLAGLVFVAHWMRKNRTPQGL